MAIPKAGEPGYQPKKVFGTPNKNYIDPGPEAASQSSEDLTRAAVIPMGDYSTPDTAESLRGQLERVSDPHSAEHDELRTRLYELSKAEAEQPKEMSQSEILDLVAEPDGGATVDLRTNKSVTSGFAHSPYPERSRAIPVADLRPDDLMNYAVDNADIFDSDDQSYLGLWNDPATNTVYLDVSVVCDDAAEARADCEVNDQIAFFDLQTFESVTVNQDAKSGQTA